MGDLFCRTVHLMWSSDAADFDWDERHGVVSGVVSDMVTATLTLTLAWPYSVETKLGWVNVVVTFLMEVSSTATENVTLTVTEHQEETATVLATEISFPLLADLETDKSKALMVSGVACGMACNCAKESNCDVESSLEIESWHTTVVAGIEMEIDVYPQAPVNANQSYHVTWSVGTLGAAGTSETVETLKDCGA